MKMFKYIQIVILGLCSMCWAIPAWAVDSYRYLHVSIDTPWAIFVFIFTLVFVPMMLLIILHWWHAMKKDKDEGDDA